jgi:hypothetical protein
MESLPPRRSAGRLRFLVLSGFALVACFLAFVLLPAGSFIWESLQQVSRLDITAVSLLGFLSFLGLTIGVAVSVATADA